MKCTLCEEDQRQKIVNDIHLNMFVEAGAGAGKTELIKNRIVKQLKEGITADRIVAITFTNKAANELRNRIFSAVKEETKKNTLKEQEKNNIEKALKCIDQMQISTIHSFCNRILKERSLDAGLSMELQLLEKDSLKRMMDESFVLWAEKLSKSDWKALIRDDTSKFVALAKVKELMEQFIGLDDSIDIKMSLETVDEATYTQKSDAFIQEFQKEILLRLKNAYAFRGTEITDCTGLEEIPDEYMTALGIKLKKMLIAGNKIAFVKEITKDGKLSVLKKLSQAEFVPLAQSMYPTITTKSGITVKVKEMQALVEEEISKVVTFLEQKKDALKKVQVGYENYINEPYIAFAKKAKQFFLERMGSDKLTNDLLIQKTYKLINQSRDSRVYFSSKFSCIYVDEFQDTDHMQEAFIRILAEDVDKPGKLRAGALFVVGDPKQSIYRFRGAEPEVYFKTKTFFMAEENKNCMVFALKNNYRSNQEIIAWVDSQFQNKDITPNQPYMCMQAVNRIPMPVQDDKVIHGVYGNHRNSTGLTTIEKDIHDLAKIILSLVNNPYSIYTFTKEGSTTKQIQFSDFLILCSEMKDMGYYMESLQKMGIPVVMDADFKVGDVWYMKAFVRVFSHLANPLDKTYQTAAIESMTNLGISEDASRAVLSKMGTITQKMLPIGILDFLESNWMNFLDVAVSFDKDSLHKLQARITQMVIKVYSSASVNKQDIENVLEDYLAGQIKHELNLNDAENAVRFMNLHKAKGLEGEIVIWANRITKKTSTPRKLKYNGCYYPALTFKGSATWYGYKGSDAIETQAATDAQAESIRLEYVAATRAKQAFIIMDPLENNSFFSKDFAITNFIQDVLPIEEKEVQDSNTEKETDKDEDRDNTKEKVEQDANGETNEDKGKLINMINTTREKKELKVPLYCSESPSTMEKEDSEPDKVKKDAGKKTNRPVGANFGTVMHRTLELIVSRIMTVKNNQQEMPALDTLAKMCYTQAISENIINIPKNQIESYKQFLKKVSDCFVRWWEEEKMYEKIDEYYTEIPFSYFYKKEEELTWCHGFADLILKLKETGEYLLIDYKSDNDEAFLTEEDFCRHLEEHHGTQLRAYRKAMKVLFEVGDEKICTQIISFTQMGTKPDEELRVRVTPISAALS